MSDRQSPSPEHRKLAVLKVGSAVLAPGGVPSAQAFRTIGASIAAIRDAGWRAVLVSSGAVACGLGRMGLASMPGTIEQRQAAAAAGQPLLITRWADALAGHALEIAQVLLTADDLEHRPRFLNARRTIEVLLDAGVVPVVNENDSVAYDEIQLGDNDRLSALVASAIGADTLLLLSVAPGLEDERGRVLPTIEDLGHARSLVRSESSTTGIGGMRTKLDAVEIATESGIETWILPGTENGVIERSLAGAGAPAGTRFPAGDPSSRARKRWIARAAKVAGSIVIDDGAVNAVVRRGASLLPSGIRDVRGGFEPGSVVDVLDPRGGAVARGLAAYSSEDLQRIAGRRSDEIESILGYIYSDAVIHRDDLVLIRDPGAARD